MNSAQFQIEELFIRKFIIKDKQERYLGFIEKEKTRNKFTRELSHFKDFKWDLFREISGSENEREAIKAKIKKNIKISTCYVISGYSQFDKKIISTLEAIENIVGNDSTILIFGNAEIVYYEAEAFDGRYISV